ncbi:T9SS type A sorting domain-containing protein [Flammeovirga aprica]|uniref:T9SS type A sorting domain-containing protein n=1 Tax=Flammeovirga aprica JL-4 TaxID=694437 RepID=A0A7X9RWP5_9BACT|nr:T9SS type A sorting domain-containing protein [Flammeovirga aprica]NME70143.1 T9SS type A sorting domain-containing protein [Flammeovirga aprica JL-4]
MKRMTKKTLYTVVYVSAITLFSLTTKAATRITMNTISSLADWNNTSNWLGGNIPTAGDDIFIQHAVVIDFKTPSFGSLTVKSDASLSVMENGDLQLDLLIGTVKINGSGNFHILGKLSAGKVIMEGTGTSIVYQNATLNLTELALKGHETLEFSTTSNLSNIEKITISEDAVLMVNSNSRKEDTYTDEIDNHSLKVYPIPSKDHVYVTKEGTIEKAESFTFELFDDMGRQYPLKNAHYLGDRWKIVLEGLSKGVYFLKISDKSQVYFERIMIE